MKGCRLVHPFGSNFRSPRRRKKFGFVKQVDKGWITTVTDTTVTDRGCNRTWQLANFSSNFLYEISFESFLSLLNQYLALSLIPECRRWHFLASRFQNILWEHAPRPPKGEEPCGPWSVTATFFNRVCCLLQNLLKPQERTSSLWKKS